MDRRRFVKIKRNCDPTNLFCLNANIRPATLKQRLLIHIAGS